MNDVVLAALASGGLGAIIVAAINGFLSKKKLGAEATEIITKAAAGVVTNLQSEVQRQERLMSSMANAHIREREEWRRVLQLHVAWDQIAISKMADLGIELPAAPPLLPPTKFVDNQGWPLPS